MKVEIPDQLIEQTGISENEIRLKLALLLFQEDRLTLGQAAKLAGLHQMEFQKELSKRNIPIHYGEEEYKNDLQTISKIK